MSADIAVNGVRHSLTYFGMVASTACREKQWHSTVDLTSALHTPVDADAPGCLLCRSGRIAKRPSKPRIALYSAEFKGWEPRVEESAPPVYVMAPKKFDPITGKLDPINGKPKVTEGDTKQRNSLRVPRHCRIDVYDADKANAFGYEAIDTGAFAAELEEREDFERLQPRRDQIRELLSAELTAHADKFIGPRNINKCADVSKHEKCMCRKRPHASSVRICATAECSVRLRPKQGQFCKKCQARIRKQRQRQREAAPPTGILITITFLPKQLEQVAS